MQLIQILFHSRVEKVSRELILKTSSASIVHHLIQIWLQLIMESSYVQTARQFIRASEIIFLGSKVSVKSIGLRMTSFICHMEEIVEQLCTSRATTWWTVMHTLDSLHRLQCNIENSLRKWWMVRTNPILEITRNKKNRMSLRKDLPSWVLVLPLSRSQQMMQELLKKWGKANNIWLKKLKSTEWKKKLCTQVKLPKRKPMTALTGPSKKQWSTN